MLKHLLYIVLLVFTFSFATAQYIYSWERIYGADSIFKATSIARTTHGNVIIVGVVKSNEQKVFVMKLNASGKVLWIRTLTDFLSLEPKDLYVAGDSSIVIVGKATNRNLIKSYIWIARLDHLGNVLWQRIYQDLGEAEASAVDGFRQGYVIGANVVERADNAFDWLVMLVDTLGFVKWYRQTGGKFDDYINDVVIVEDNIVVVGYQRYNEGETKSLAISIYDFFGNEIYFQRFDSLGFSEGLCATRTYDTGFAVAGYKLDQFDRQDIVVLKFDKDGELLWQKVVYMPYREVPFSIIEAFDKTLVLAFNLWTSSFPYSDFGVLQLSKQGELKFLRLFRRGSDDFIAQIIENQDNGLMLLATIYEFGIGWKLLLIKCMSTENSDLWFLVPKAKIVAVKEKLLRVKACVKGYDVPQKVEIIVNGNVIDTITQFAITDNSKCQFYFEAQIPLKYGYNKVEFRVTDYKGYTFVRRKVVFVIPLPSRRW